MYLPHTLVESHATISDDEGDFYDKSPVRRASPLLVNLPVAIIPSAPKSPPKTRRRSIDVGFSFPPTSNKKRSHGNSSRHHHHINSKNAALVADRWGSASVTSVTSATTNFSASQQQQPIVSRWECLSASPLSGDAALRRRSTGRSNCDRAHEPPRRMPSSGKFGRRCTTGGAVSNSGNHQLHQEHSLVAPFVESGDHHPNHHHLLQRRQDDMPRFRRRSEPTRMEQEEEGDDSSSSLRSWKTLEATSDFMCRLPMRSKSRTEEQFLFDQPRSRPSRRSTRRYKKKVVVV